MPHIVVPAADLARTRPATSIDATFPGESEPDQADCAISAYFEPCYIRS